MNLWLVSNIRLESSEGLKASGIQNLKTADALARAGHQVLVWCDHLGPDGVSWAEKQIGREFPDSLHVMQASARGGIDQKRSAFGTASERIWHFMRGRMGRGAPDAILSRSPTVLRQLRASRFTRGRTRLILELQYPEWSFRWRSWARRNRSSAVPNAVRTLRAFKAEEAEGYRAADGILYAARAHESLLDRENFRGPRRWIPSAAETPEMTARPEGLEFSLGYAGSLAPENGLELLLEALTRLPGEKLLILGAGRRGYVRHLTERVRDLAIEERVTFAGQVSPADVRSWMRRCRAGVVPISRRWGAEKRLYASPLKLIEWMAAGVPVIASRVPSITQHHAAGEPIALFEPDDAGSLGQLAAALLGDEPKLRDMVERGIEAARKRDFRARARILSDFAGSLDGMAVAVHGQ